MNASDIQTIYLLERYISPEYFEDLLQIWRKFVVLNEESLDRYMHNLPATARSRPLPQQADITWSGTVLPNLRSTLEALEDGYRRILSGDLNGLAAAKGPVFDNRGIVDFSVEWMTKDELTSFEDLLARAYLAAFNIDRTEGAYWSPGSLSFDYDSSHRGPLELPAQLPRYQVVKEPGVRSGYRVPIAGIYIADAPHSSPQFLNSRFEAPNAEVLLGYRTVLSPLDGSVCGKDALTEHVECTWNRVIRLADPIQAASTTPKIDWARVPAGERCRETGYYFSPAQTGSRRRFNLGDLMPDLGSNFGNTIWQWDQDQSDNPK